VITGSGTTAKFTHQFYGDVPWLWICDDIETVDGVPQHDALFGTIVRTVDENPDFLDVVVSSQVQIGTTVRLEALFPERRFAYMPENYRVIASTPQRPKYWVCGTRHREFATLVRHQLTDTGANKPYITTIVECAPEDAEMVKHATNVWLAMSIQFGKDIAALGAKFGADPQTVAETLKADPRIGVGAYIAPHGEPSPHLKREVWNLQRLGGGKIIDVLEAQ